MDLVFSNKENLRYPHIGIVIIEDYCEIGCNSTIDRDLCPIQLLVKILI